MKVLQKGLNSFGTQFLKNEVEYKKVAWFSYSILQKRAAQKNQLCDIPLCLVNFLLQCTKNYIGFFETSFFKCSSFFEI